MTETGTLDLSPAALIGTLGALRTEIDKLRQLGHDVQGTSMVGDKDIEESAQLARRLLDQCVFMFGGMVQQAQVDASALHHARTISDYYLEKARAEEAEATRWAREGIEITFPFPRTRVDIQEIDPPPMPYAPGATCMLQVAREASPALLDFGFLIADCDEATGASWHVTDVHAGVRTLLRGEDGAPSNLPLTRFTLRSPPPVAFEKVNDGLAFRVDLVNKGTLPMILPRLRIIGVLKRPKTIQEMRGGV